MCIPTILLLLTCVICVHRVEGIAKNRTIDDTYGDEITDFQPLYAPTNGVWEGTDCTDCAIIPDKSKAHNGTWMGATYGHEMFEEMSVTLRFKGTAIYVFFILANFVAPTITTETVCDFILDDQPIGFFSHKPTTSRELDYNVLAFHRKGLENIDHTLVISTSGITDRHIFVNFDYALYTFDDDVLISSSSSGSISTTSVSSAAPSSMGVHSSTIQGSHSPLFSPSRTPDSSMSSTIPSPSSSPTPIQIQGAASQTTPSNLDNVEGTTGSSINVGVVAGSAIGGFVALVVIVFLLVFLYRRKHRPRPARQATAFVIDEDPSPITPIPFSINTASIEERNREHRQTHSDFLQSGTILSSAPTSHYAPSDYNTSDVSSRAKAHLVPRTKGIREQSSTISEPPPGYSSLIKSTK